MVEMLAQIQMANMTAAAPPGLQTPQAAPAGNVKAEPTQVQAEAGEQTAAAAANTMDTTSGNPGVAAAVEKLTSSVKLPNDLLAAMRSEAAKFGKVVEVCRQIPLVGV